mgnify:CR=1 FL=1
MRIRAGSTPKQATARRAASDPDARARQEITQKVDRLVQQRYGGDTRRAFDAYARNGEVDRRGVVRMLEDAGVGSGLAAGVYRGAVAGRLVDEFDAGPRNGRIGYDELLSGLARNR